MTAVSEVRWFNESDLSPFMSHDVFDEEAFLEHFGVRGMKWGVRRADGGAIPSNVKRNMEKRETRFQTKRSDANAKVTADRASGKISPKHTAKASKLNTQHKLNQEHLKSQGLEIYKKMPSSVKNSSASELAKSKPNAMSNGQKAAVYILAGPVLGHLIIKSNER
jgi:hypothetical protein